MTTPRKLPSWAERSASSPAPLQTTTAATASWGNSSERGGRPAAGKEDDSNLPAFFHVKGSDGSAGYTMSRGGGLSGNSSSLAAAATLEESGSQLVTYQDEPGQFIKLWGPLLANQGIQMDRISLFSVTPIKLADDVSRILVNLAGISQTESIVTDGTACVGGNAVSFAKFFHNVNAIELDEMRCSMLYNNVEVARKTSAIKANVKVFCEDSLEIIPRLRQDIVFLDPPWGGKDYKSKATVPLYLCAKPIHEVVLHCLKYTKFVALKLPKNAELAYLQKDQRLEIILSQDFPSFLLLVCRSLVTGNTRETKLGGIAQGGTSTLPASFDLKMEQLLVNLVNTKPFQEILKTSANVIKPT